MPRPTPAQFLYGSATVVLSALAMLLLSQTRSGGGVAVIAGVALALGLLVALTVPITWQQRRPAEPEAERAAQAPAATTERQQVRRAALGRPRAGLRPGP
ncbi:hypothetical protein RKE29_23015, partial [Streptomyces sp. B1866]|uniref:hypothetical protein n=1 Tax=Streptomyces sp. B1866 TaxID=3075431 RepID=UPI00288DD660